MKLFDDCERTDRSPARHQEDSFTFLNRAEGVVWGRIRDVLDAWFADYPVQHAADLRGRFQSNRRGAHWSAWWELYLHRLFTRLGYEAVVHPDVPGTSRHPDFELTRADERLYLEAVVVFSGVEDDKRDGVREGWIMDAVNRGTSKNFYVLIEFEKVGAQRPKDQDVYRPLENWLAGLDPDQVSAEYEQTGSLPTKTFTVRDWLLSFEALPIKPEARSDEPGRLLGGGPASGGFVNDKEQLRDTLKHKRGRYGTAEVPLVVAVNCASSFMDDSDIANALYGAKAVQYEMGVPGSSHWVRLRDGTWMSEQGPRGQRMSAVLSTVQLHPWTAVKTTPRLWLNPWPHVPLNTHWPFTAWSCSDHGVVTNEEGTPQMADLLGLPPDWPGPEKPFD
jgi:hypothetical protein